MFNTIVVGYDGTDEARDALGLAREMAGDETRVIAANVYELGGVAPGPTFADWEKFMREDAETMLAEIAGVVDTRAVGDHSAVHGLHELAEEEHADLIVVGSCHYGPIGRVLAGSVGEKLARNAPCVVAIAPSSHRQTSHEALHGLTEALI